MRVALIGMGPSADAYARHAAIAGDRNAVFDETWTVNAFGSVFQVDRTFHMDDVRIQQIRADGGNKQIANMLEWLKKQPGPIFTSRTHPDYPGLIEFPLEEVVNSTGNMPYFNSTPAYAIAYAMHIGVTRLMLFGIDYTFTDRYMAERGRACVEFWLGRAMQRGMEIVVPRGSSLFDNDRNDVLYGYDTRRVITDQDKEGKLTIAFEEIEKLPTAEEIEAHYDYSMKEKPNGKCSVPNLQVGADEGDSQRLAKPKYDNQRALRGSAG